MYFGYVYSFRFDPRTCTWTKLASMKTRRQSFPLVGSNGRLIAFGGGIPVSLIGCYPCFFNWAIPRGTVECIIVCDVHLDAEIEKGRI